MTFTKEQLIERCEEAIASLKPCTGLAETKSLACFEIALSALAWMEAEPVAYIGERMLESLIDGARSCGRVWPAVTDEISGERRIPLYTAPQPLTTSERAELENYRNAQQVVNYQHLSELYHAQEKRLFKLAQRIKGPAFDKYAHSPSQAIDVLESAIFGEREDEDCRAAMKFQRAQED